MYSCKIHNSERQRKKEKERVTFNHATPPKLIMKSSVINTVHRWEKHFGYDFDVPESEITPVLRRSRQEFREKAAIYCRGDVFTKKQTRFDKMRLKEETGFSLEELPIRKRLRKADLIITTLMKKQALFALAALK